MPADDVAVAIVPEGLRFTWFVAAHTPWPDNTDQVMLLAYFPDTESVIYNFFGALRTDGAGVLNISEPLMGEYFETYICVYFGRQIAGI